MVREPEHYHCWHYMCRILWILQKKIGVRWSSLSMILQKFLKFGKSSLDDSYKNNSYKKMCVCRPIWFNILLSNEGLQENVCLSLMICDADICPFENYVTGEVTYIAQRGSEKFVSVPELIVGVEMRVEGRGGDGKGVMEWVFSRESISGSVSTITLIPFFSS